MVLVLFSFCSTLLLFGCSATEAKYARDPDTYRNVSELITSKGYPAEEHIVQTADGYLLSLIRIPHGRNDLKTNQMGPVLLVHGLLGDSSNWVLNFPDQSLGFMLSDAGYDAWLLNTRGNIYSKKHIKYTTKQYAFWNFSFEEVGLYDIPATIDYILDATGKKDLYLIGHSQGNTAGFATLSELPEYNDKVRLLIALAPPIFMGTVTTPIRYLVPISDEIAFIIDIFTAGEFLSDNKLFRPLRVTFCELAQELCEDLLFIAGGRDRSQINQTRFEAYVGHFPAGSSTKSILHYAQLIATNKYRKYDYKDKNMEHYNQAYPPDFDLPSITTPVALFWSSNDRFVSPIGVEELREKLNSVVFYYEVPYAYDHFDYVLALNGNQLVYEPILRLLSQY